MQPLRGKPAPVSALRAVAGLNAIFQLAVGALAIAAPILASQAFHVADAAGPTPSPHSVALVRMFGGLLAASGVLSALVAREGAHNRALLFAAVSGCALNVATDLVVIGTGGLAAADLAVGIALQLSLIAVGIGPLTTRSASRALAD
jgi:hypothetical protein